MVSYGADAQVPTEALRHGTWRTGTHQDNNLYVEWQGDEYYVGVLFRASYGRPVCERLNATLPDTPSGTDATASRSSR